MEKINLAYSSLNILKRIYELAPQTDEQGNLRYYICGALATNILPLVMSMEDYEINDMTGEMKKGDIFTFDDNTRKVFLNCVRPSGSGDIDFACINNSSNTPNLIAYSRGHILNVAEIVKGSGECVKDIYPNLYESFLKNDSTPLILDRTYLGNGQSSHYVTECTLVDGTKFWMPSVEALFFYKRKQCNAYIEEINYRKNVSGKDTSQAEKKLESASADFNNLYDGISCIIKEDKIPYKKL